MGFSVFDDETLGAAGLGRLTLYGSGNVSTAWPETLISGRIRNSLKNDFGITGVSVKVNRLRGGERPASITVSIDRLCSHEIGEIIGWVKTAAETMFDSGTVIFTRTEPSGCPVRPQLGLLSPYAKDPQTYRDLKTRARRKAESPSNYKPLSEMTWDEIFQEYGYAIAAAGLIVILLLKR